MRLRPSRRRALAMGAAAGLTCMLRGAVAAPSDEGDEQALQADADYSAGRAASRAGRHADALPLLQRALRRFPDAADLHNELGYAHRKLNQLAPAFEHYRRALSLRPDHRSAHEYIGEAYLMVDDLPQAEVHLAALRRLCLLGCEELHDLEQAIARYRQARAKPADSSSR